MSETRSKKLHPLEYVWFIEPLNSHTNETVGRQLSAELERECNDVLCADQKRRNLWKCDNDFCRRLKRDRKRLKLKFNIFKQLPNKTMIFADETYNVRVNKRTKKSQIKALKKIHKE